MTKQGALTRMKQHRVPAIFTALLVIGAFAFRTQLTAWFSGKAGKGDTSAGQTVTAGNLTLTTSLQPDAPREKGNEVHFVLADKAGKPVKGATIQANITMPAMGSMSEMRTKAAVSEAGEGAYKGAFDLAMGGTWTLAVDVKSGDDTLSASYTLTVGTSGLVSVSSGGSGSNAPTLQHAFAGAARGDLSKALIAYEQLRVELAADRAGALAASAAILAGALGAAKKAETGAAAAITAHFDGAITAANELQSTTSLKTARTSFAQLSKHMVGLTSADPAVHKDLHQFECGMTKGYNKWLQPNAQLANPYQGAAMLSCGEAIEFKSAAAPAHDHDHVHGGNEVDHYTCPMETWVKAKKPGACPVCGMDLLPVTKAEMKTGVMRIDHRRRQLIGLRLAKIDRQSMTLKIRAVGRVVYDESRLADVTLKYDGFINRLLVNKTGQKVRRGQTLFTLYSPQLYNAQQEYLLALSQREIATSEVGRRRADALVMGARQRLKLWDISNWQLKQIAKKKKPIKYISIPSPATGYVVEKRVVAGAAVKAGDQLFRIAGLDRVWVEADVYEKDLPHVKKGQAAQLSLSHIPNRTFAGKVAFVYPYLDRHARTARVRIELPNKDKALKPDMYANVEFEVPLGEKLAVPEAAVIYSGPRRIVFIDIGGDRLRPKQVTVGAKANGYFEVLSGLSVGDNVVISGNFLLSAESRLKSATGLW